MGRTIVIGDVHGCLEELVELMEKLEVGPSDRMVFLGDLIDRGPMPVETVRFVRELGCEAVMGNHEMKCLRWLRNEAVRRETGRENGMRPPRDDRRRQWEALSAEDLDWMSKMPFTVDLTEGWKAVHGGFEPKPLDEQQNDRMVRLRYLKAKTLKPAHLADLAQPKDTVYWAEVWNQPFSVVYGHAVHGGFPRVDWRAPGDGGGGRGLDKTWCIGIDTGCCFGGPLTALVTDDGFKTWSFAQVAAKREYQKRIPGMNAIKPLQQ